ncbi:lytic polysaccharide monooxygenase [Streptomyces sp. MUM 203J]|uniref:lytic polysaccharide monooxygenase auxiliary activity family 9 protein n=1 Tax=Streptomyces sp. MUM 203J TaxID=2791990 RepID=UPI001F04B2A7|nr:lytic polysaccharide monooxygenase [Streptomyces sp. MUM 203J]MCH0541881.1 lytic polysaccharide monooxygenase [Streptomyces sp. MUM 203J]
MPPSRRPSPARRAASVTAAALAAAAAVPLIPAAAHAHGAVFNPVSRVAACYAEGPERPASQVCKDLVADSGTQPLYDWNEVNIADAAGRHREIIPDGKLCSAGREKYRALDWARADWPSTAVAPGPFDFKVRVTAPHSGTMTVYITKEGFEPTQPLTWADLDETPVASYDTTRTAADGYYSFSGALPARTGRHIIYKVWQRDDSPEAFYSCSDVTFGAPSTAADAPTEQEIAAGAERSTVSHAGHGGDERPPALSAAPAEPAASPLPLALAGAGAIAVFAVGGLGLSLRRRP